jgi:DNA-binding transcriptional ArsR family regulator
MTTTIDDYRAVMAQARVESIDFPGCYLDRSPTGSGKSHADIAAVIKAGTSLVVTPTHDNCEEQVELFYANGITAVAYPAMTEETCKNYETASDCLNAGLNMSAAVCLTCELRENCYYIRQMKEAERSDNRLATHARAALSLAELMHAANFISIHEDATNVVRPTKSATDGFDRLVHVAQLAAGMAWNASILTPNNSLRAFFEQVIRTAEFFRDELSFGDRTRLLQLSDFITTAPPSAEATLFRAMKELKVRPPADVTRIVLAAVQGRLKSVTVRIDSFLVSGGQTDTKRSLQAVWRNEIGEQKTVWFCDATASHEELTEIIGQPVRDMTPSGRLQLRQTIAQVTLDVTKRTTPQKIVAILSAILVACPGFDRIGIIAHREHCPLIQGNAKADAKLSPELQRRIAKIEHHRSGAGRGSNAWHAECDLLIVLGTPRVPPAAVRTRLIQANQAAAATCTAEQAGWGKDYWLAKTIAGSARQVQFLTYSDHRWHRAHAAIVAAELRQAVGRGRGLLDSGIPVVVVTTTPLGYRVVDHDPLPMTVTEDEILTVMRTLSEEKLTEHFAKGAAEVENTDLTEHSANTYILGECSVNPCPIFAREIGSRIGKSESYVSRTLAHLEEHGIVRRIGRRGGWQPTERPPIVSKGAGRAGDEAAKGGAA